MGLDKTDKKIIKNLMKDARISARQLALKIGLSTVTVLTKIKKLENEKIKNVVELEEKLSKIDNVCCVYDTTGSTDAIIVAKFKERDELSSFVKSLSTMTHVENTITHVVLNTAKEDFRLT
ncbi:MAG: Lrp/AsnC family transcriptional regulator [Candidatus Bathyarchaeota archaeon]